MATYRKGQDQSGLQQRAAEDYKKSQKNVEYHAKNEDRVMGYNKNTFKDFSPETSANAGGAQVAQGRVTVRQLQDLQSERGIDTPVSGDAMATRALDKTGRYSERLKEFRKQIGL